MEEKQGGKLPLHSIEDAVLTAELILNLEEIRRTIARLDEPNNVSQTFLRTFEFNI